MYLPKYFSCNEELKVRKLIEQNSFVTLLSFPKDAPVFINHLPFIFSSKAGDENILIGHMSKRNPQWMHFKENENSMIIVQGGHTYITPQWYQSGRDVPTWNYAVAHLSGKIDLVESFAEQVDILKELSDFFENSSVNPWEFELPSDLIEESTLTSAIVSFKFTIEKIEAKFKLSQNRSAADKNGIIEGLSGRTDEMSKVVREMMIEDFKTK